MRNPYPWLNIWSSTKWDCYLHFTTSEFWLGDHFPSEKEWVINTNPLISVLYATQQLCKTNNPFISDLWEGRPALAKSLFMMTVDNKSDNTADCYSFTHAWWYLIWFFMLYIFITPSSLYLCFLPFSNHHLMPLIYVKCPFLMLSDSLSNHPSENLIPGGSFENFSSLSTNILKQKRIHLWRYNGIHFEIPFISTSHR